ncbi:Panacea domain-containing protein [Bifidobacterium crudilactis]|jgi:uncharacterized phage-associated protein|uniref:Panacea domain-containing protein n=1 Tax=Bifidobacterium crudilactis TaxID=327277 RepID=UPI002F34F5F5|nr:DUF4065 domain-containing protein [Bifidobacterium crudilactis]MCI1664634.1 DUF4065 domain-containing protein [Bifidobacterium crudilactis]
MDIGKLAQEAASVKYSASDIALWFLNWADTEDEPDNDDEKQPVSNLKLQKLLYYAQGIHLAMYGKPLFLDEIEAWAHGPVVPSVYRSYKYCNSDSINDPIVCDRNYDWKTIDPADTAFLAGIWDQYGQYSAWKLRNMTHSESPWKNVYVPNEQHIPITRDSMREYFESIQK